VALLSAQRRRFPVELSASIGKPYQPVV